MVTPPGDKPKRDKYNDYLGRKDVNLADNARLSNAQKLGAWIEWLKHPEDHDGVRVIFKNDGEKMEFPCNAPNDDNPPPPGYYIDDQLQWTLPDRNGVRDGEQYYLAYESAIEKWYFSQFFGPQTAVSTQHVERAGAPFPGTIAVLTEIIWRVDDFNFRLADTPDKIGAWHGDAGKIYGNSAAAMCDLNSKIQELIDGFIPRIAEYCALIKRTREALNESCGKTIEEFTKKIPGGGDPGDFFKWILGIGVDTANASGKDLTAGTKDPLSTVAKTNLVGVLWDTVIGGLLGLITGKSGDYQPPESWTSTAEKYLDNQGQILADATARMHELADAIASLQKQLTEAHIPPLPQG